MAADLDFGEIFKKLTLLEQQHSEAGTELNILSCQIGELTSLLLSGLDYTTQGGELKKHILRFQDFCGNELRSLNILKEEISKIFGLSLSKSDLGRNRSGQNRRERGGKIEGTGTIGGKDGSDGKGSVSETINAEDNFFYRSMVERLQEKEKKICEQAEMLDVYATIVSQYDTEEKKRVGVGKGIEEASEYQKRIEGLEQLLEKVYMENEMLKGSTKFLQEERDDYIKEKEMLEGKVRGLELTLLGASQWHKAVVGSFSEEDTSSLNSSIYKSLRKAVITPEVIKAKVVSPDSWVSETPNNNRRVGRGDGTFSSGVSKAVNPLLAQLRALPPIDVSNPSAQESRLLQRIEIYESRLGELEEWEIDKKRCFDEMEKTRAEFFSSMNAELDKQKKTIDRLSLERDSLRNASIPQKNCFHTTDVSSKRDYSVTSLYSVGEERSEENVYPQQRGLLLISTLIGSEKEKRLEIESEYLLEFSDVAFSFLSTKGKEFCGKEKELHRKELEGTTGKYMYTLSNSGYSIQKGLLDEKLRSTCMGLVELYEDYLEGVEEILFQEGSEEATLQCGDIDDIGKALRTIQHLKEKKV